MVLSTDTADKSLQRHFKFSPSIQPRAMHAVAGAVKIAAPDAIEAHQNVALNLRTNIFQLIGKSDRRTRLQMTDPPEWPFISRPIPGRDQLPRMTKIDNPLAEPLQVSLRAAARR